MSKNIFIKCLDELGLNEKETADLFCVHPRTVSRWVKNADSIPEQVKATLITWIRLKRLNLSWRPNAIALGQKNTHELSQLIAQFQIHTLEIDEAISLVRARGGPTTSWTVDLHKKIATIHFMSVSFAILDDGGFLPLDYTRHDNIEADPARDLILLQDAYFAIHNSLQQSTQKN